jgi:ATP-binding cassette subfamily C protein EexD
VSYKISLYSGGQGASSQALDDLTALRQFLTGNGLFAFFDVPWIPIYIGVMFVFHPAYGWTAVGTAILLIIIAIVQEKSTAKMIGEANTMANRCLFRTPPG